jgi:hypothetical protein
MLPTRLPSVRPTTRKPAASVGSRRAPWGVLVSVLAHRHAHHPNGGRGMFVPAIRRRAPTGYAPRCACDNAPRRTFDAFFNLEIFLSSSSRLLRSRRYLVFLPARMTGR